jgi:hypothetical protein
MRLFIEYEVRTYVCAVAAAKPCRKRRAKPGGRISRIDAEKFLAHMSGLAKIVCETLLQLFQLRRNAGKLRHAQHVAGCFSQRVRCECTWLYVEVIAECGAKRHRLRQQLVQVIAHAEVECEPRVAAHQWREYHPTPEAWEFQHRVVIGSIGRVVDVTADEAELSEASEGSTERVHFHCGGGGEERDAKVVLEANAQRRGRLGNGVQDAKKRAKAFPPDRSAVGQTPRIREMRRRLDRRPFVQGVSRQIHSVPASHAVR